MKVRLTDLYFPESSFLLFEDWSDTGFSPVLRHLFSSPWPFKDDKEWLSNNICSALMGVSLRGLWICGCVPFGPIDSWLSGLPKWSLTWFSSNKGRSSFLQTFFLPSRVWDSQGPASVVKTETKKAFSNSVFPISCVSRVPTSLSRRFSFYLFLILLPMYLKELFFLSLSHPCTPWQHPCISPKWFASFSTFCKLHLPWSRCQVTQVFYPLCACLWVRNQVVLT